MSGKRLQRLVATFFSFVALVGAQPLCDPKSEFQLGGQCCQLCPPGTSMSSLGNCLEPQCRGCEDGDYQDKFTKEAKCLRQPYCDPHKNFQLPVHDPRQRSQCVCRDGFHCSSQACLTCVPHTACGPGYGVNLRGNHSRDTVCEECPQGTFSASSSRTEVCQKWTECPHGQQLVQSGTARSDIVCGGQARTHVIAIVLAAVAGLVVLALVGLALTVGRRRCLDGKTKSCWDLWPGEEKGKDGGKEEGKDGGKEEAPKEHQPLVATPSDAADESTQRQVSRDEPRTPEEVDDLSQEISITTEVHFTDNGQFVMQDKGMKEMKSEEA